MSWEARLDLNRAVRRHIRHNVGQVDRGRWCQQIEKAVEKKDANVQVIHCFCLVNRVTRPAPVELVKEHRAK